MGVHERFNRTHRGIQSMFYDWAGLESFQAGMRWLNTNGSS
ncbi:MAG: hypothetical protein RIQ93_3306, partial [Verrucomicrobiota bacterium]